MVRNKNKPWYHQSTLVHPCLSLWNLNPGLLHISQRERENVGDVVLQANFFSNFL